MFAPTEASYVIEIVEVSNQRGQDGSDKALPAPGLSPGGHHEDGLVAGAPLNPEPWVALASVR